MQRAVKESTLTCTAVHVPPAIQAAPRLLFSHACVTQGFAMMILTCAGWDVAAFTDVMSEWGPDIRGMCGLCVEVRCKNMKFKDGFVSAAA